LKVAIPLEESRLSFCALHKGKYVCNSDVVKYSLTINLDISFPGLAVMAGVTLPLGAGKG
jgi:hypothetical protein